MLHEFLIANRDELIAETLRSETVSDELTSRRISGVGDPGTSPTASEIGESAATHGDELQKKGFPVDQVVHDYGDLCQAITELAVEQKVPIAVTEFRTLNRCLDSCLYNCLRIAAANTAVSGFPRHPTLGTGLARWPRDGASLFLPSGNL